MNDLIKLNDNLYCFKQVFIDKLMNIIASFSAFSLLEIELKKLNDLELQINLRINCDANLENLRLELYKLENKISEMLFYFVSFEAKIIIRIG